jgi:hypothetical protein
MLAEYHLEMKFILCTLAVWRLTHLFVKEDGPWDFVFRIRKLLGNSVAGKAMDCFYCFSIWMALPFAFIVAGTWLSILITWIALSGAACLLEQFSSSRNAANENDHSSS